MGQCDANFFTLKLIYNTPETFVLNGRYLTRAIIELNKSSETRVRIFYVATNSLRLTVIVDKRRESPGRAKGAIFSVVFRRFASFERGNTNLMIYFLDAPEKKREKGERR